MESHKDQNQNFLISVLMTAYNSEEYIAEAIESILGQTYKSFEFLINDDASTDRTWLIIQEYAKKDPRISATRNENNLGIAASRNKLILRAKGKYIAWQDADDISLAQRLFKQAPFLTANPKIGIVGGQIKFIDINGDLFVKRYPTADGEIRKNIFRYNPISQSASMIKKECFDKIGLYDEKYPLAGDLDLFFRIGQRFKLANLDEVILIYRQHRSSNTYSKTALTEKLGYKIRNYYKNDSHYYFRLIDRFYSWLYFISPYIIPRKLKIYLFNKWRNSKS